MSESFKERIGVGQPHYGLGKTGPTRQRSITAEEGPRKGKTGAVYTDHADGRTDATVLVDPIRTTISQKEQ